MSLTELQELKKMASAAKEESALERLQRMAKAASPQPATGAATAALTGALILPKAGETARLAAAPAAPSAPAVTAAAMGARGLTLPMAGGAPKAGLVLPKAGETLTLPKVRTENDYESELKDLKWRVRAAEMIETENHSDENAAAADRLRVQLNSLKGEYNTYRTDKYNAKIESTRAGLESVLSAPGFLEAAERGKTRSNTIENAFNADYSHPVEDGYVLDVGKPKYLYMTDDERNVYAYWFGTDRRKAAEYMDTLDRELDRRKSEDESRTIEEASNESKVRGLALNLGSSYATPLAYLETAKQGIKNLITGEYEPVNVHSPMMSGVNAEQASRRGLTRDIESPFADFLAQNGLSLLQYASKVPLGPQGALIVMSSGAAGSMTTEAARNGASTNEALALGTIAGVAEYVLESIPLDNLFEIFKSGKQTAKTAFKNIAKQAGEEGLEELLSEYVNIVADNAIMQDRSKINRTVDELMASGMSQEEAEREAKLQAYVYDPLTAFAGGALSGGAMGGLGSIGAHLTGDINSNSNLTPNALLVKTSQAKTRTAVSGIMTGVSDSDIQTAERLSKALGVGIEFYSRPGNTSGMQNGYYENGKIFVNSKSRNPISQIVSHELTHSIEQSGAYEGLRELVMRQLTTEGQDINSLREAKRAAYEASGIKLTSGRGVDGEIVAEFVEKRLLTDERSIRELVRQDRNIAQRIFDWIGNLIKKLTGTPEERALSHARRLYADALSEIRQGDASSAQFSVNDNLQQAIGMLESGMTPSEIFNRTGLVVTARGDITDGLGGEVLYRGGIDQARVDRDNNRSPGYGSERAQMEEPYGRGDIRTGGEMGSPALSQTWGELGDAQRSGIVRIFSEHISKSLEPGSELELLVDAFSQEKGREAGLAEMARRIYDAQAQSRVAAEKWTSLIPDLQNLMDEFESIAGRKYSVTDKSKVSRVRSNTFEKSSIFDKAELEMSEMADSNFLYDVIGETQSMERAQARLDLDFDGEVENLKSLPAWGGEDIDAAMGVLRTYVQEAREDGRYSKVTEWAKLIREKGTQAGQMIQAFAKYTRTPEGILVKAAQTLEQNTDPATADAVLKDMAEFSETLEVIEDGDTDELIDLIIKQANRRGTKVSKRTLKNLKGEAEFKYLYDFAMTQLENIAMDYERVSAGRKISTYQAVAHLFNLRTALRNIVSNQVFDIVDAAANNLSLIPDALLGTITGRRTVGTQKSWLSAEKRSGAREGARRSAAEIALDVQPHDQASKYGTGQRRTFRANSKNAMGRAMSNVEKAMGFELSVTDEFHKGSVRAEVLESLSGLIERGDITAEQAREFAEQEALYRSFQDDTLPGAMLAGLKNIFNLIGFGDSGKRLGKAKIKEFGLGDLIQKYTQVPGSLISRAVEFSPLGYLKTIPLLAEAQKGGGIKASAEAQRNIALAIGRATTGTGFITAFAVLAGSGLLRRAEDEEDADIAALNAAEGMQGTQLNMSALARSLSGEGAEWRQGDTLIDLNFMEPLNAMMTLGALVAQDAEDSGLWGKVGKTITKSPEALFQALKDAPTMQTIDGIYNTIKYHDPETDLPLWAEIPVTIAESGVTGFVPSIIRQGAQASDRYYRDQYTSQNQLEQTRDRLLNTLPGARQTLPTKLTNFGEGRGYESPVLNALNAAIFPGGVTEYKQGDVSRELARVRNATEDVTIYPDRNAPYSVMIDGEKLSLTSEERRTFQETRGQAAHKLMSEIMSSAEYNSAGDFEKAEILSDAVSYTNDMAKRELAESRGIVYTTNTWNKTHEAVKAGVPFSAYRGYVNSTAGLETKEKLKALTAMKLTDDQKGTLYSIQFTAQAKKYGKLVDAGIGAGDAYKLSSGIDMLEPLPGKESVSNNQTYTVVAESGLNELDKVKALSTMMTDTAYKKLFEARKALIPTKTYIKYLTDTADIAADKNADGNSISGSAKIKVLTYINRLMLLPEQKDALYRIAGYAESQIGSAPWRGGASYQGDIYGGTGTTSGTLGTSGSALERLQGKVGQGTTSTSAPSGGSTGSALERLRSKVGQ